MDVRNSDNINKERPGWPEDATPPLYKRIWAAVQTPAGLASTPLLSSLLLTSGLPTDTLGHIWALANRTVPGALTRHELYNVLALVGLAQLGYAVNNLGVLQNLPHAPIPTLDLSKLPPVIDIPTTYPTPLNVFSLPEAKTMTWTPQEASHPRTDKIDISYISSGPMLSQNLFSEQCRQSRSDLDQVNLQANTIGLGTSVNRSDSVHSGHELKPKLHSKHSNHFTFSFPLLSESPTNLKDDSHESDAFDDEFTDFQSANCSSHGPIVENVGNDKSSSFQKASPDFDDHSVLVVSGGSTSTAHKLWVTEREGFSDQKNVTRPDKSVNDLLDLSGTYVKDLPSSLNVECSSRLNISGDAFRDIKGNTSSVFLNSLPGEKNSKSIDITLNAEDNPSHTASIFSSSSTNSPDISVDLFSCDNPASSSLESKIQVKESDDDEFCNFQNFPVNLPTTCNNTLDKVDKYQVFRTFTLADNAEEPSESNKTCVNDSTIQSKPENDVMSKEIKEQYENIETTDVRESDHLSSQRTELQVDSLLSSQPFSKNYSKEEDQKTLISSDGPLSDDKYKALRLLETGDDEFEEFGEFLGAEITNSNTEPHRLNTVDESSSVQIRCLEVCLDLLKFGCNIFSKSSPEVISEVLSDPKAKNYLDCLVEVSRVGERIRRHLRADTCPGLAEELDLTCETLTPFFTHSKDNQMAEAEGETCIVCRCRVGPSPVTLGAQSFHSPCANLYLHCVEPMLPHADPASTDQCVCSIRDRTVISEQAK